MAQKSLEAIVEGLSAAECKRMLLRLANEIPEASDALTDWLIPARSDLLPQIAHMRHRLSCYVEWREAGGVALEVDRLLDRARSLPAKQRWSAASELAEALIENLDNVHDEGEIYGAAERACALLVEVALETGREVETLERLLELEDGPYSEIPWAAAERVADAVPARRDQLESWLVGTYEAVDPASASYRHQSLGRRLKSLYLATGRDADYLALLKSDLGRPEAYLEWARYLDAAGQRDEALARAREGVARHRDRPGELALVDFLVDTDGGPEWLERRFLLRPSTEDYIALRRATGYAFLDHRTRLLEGARKQPALLAALLVLDEDLPALGALLAACPDVQVAERAAPFFPAEASTIFRRQAERACEGRDRKAYRVGAQWAKKSRAISQADEFGSWLKAFLDRNRRYPALQEEFDALRT